MKIRNIQINKFRRFESLAIRDIPPAKLVVLSGPNGSGKSSLFDAFSTWYQAHVTGMSWDAKYHSREGPQQGWNNQVGIEFHDGRPNGKSFYIRSAYRHDPEFEISSLHKLSDPTGEVRVRRMIESDGAVSQNYQRLASNAFQDVFDRVDEKTTVGEFRDNAIGEISRAIEKLFPDLKLNTLGNPLVQGTFQFSKGKVDGFSYKNLSGGEKAAFDLLLDILIKKRSFDDTVFAIDEPEVHINTKLQSSLLKEIYSIIPENCQLWISTHSIGMMRAAKELYEKYPDDVIFFDFEGHDFDQEVSLSRSSPDRRFWQRILHVALDDLAELVCPEHVVVCEGNPATPTPGKNESHDAKCYGGIFEAHFPDTMFVSGGNSKDVANDRLKLASMLSTVAKGIKVRRLIDRDDHSREDIESFRKDGIDVLSRRHIESYLWDDEIVMKLYVAYEKQEEFDAFCEFKRECLQKAYNERHRPLDDIKASAGNLYKFVKHQLSLSGCGDDPEAFARNVLVPLVTPETATYQALKKDVFGDR